MERAKIYKCEDSRSKTSRQDEKEKSRGRSHELGQSDCEVEWLSEMLGVIQTDEKNLVETAEEVHKRNLRKDEKVKEKEDSCMAKQGFPKGDEMKKRKVKIEEEEQTENFGPCLGKPEEESDYGRLKFNCDLDEWQIKDQQPEIQEDDSENSEHAGHGKLEAKTT